MSETIVNYVWILMMTPFSGSIVAQNCRIFGKMVGGNHHLDSIEAFLNSDVSTEP